MRFSTRQKLRRGLLAALLAITLAPLLAGCGEDRSNLIPRGTAESLLAQLNRVQDLAETGHCFEAAAVAVEAQREIETMDAEVDPRLKRSLVDGVTELQVLANDPEVCADSGIDPEAPVEIEVEPSEPEGDTGDLDFDEGTTGAQGTTDDDDEDSAQQPRNEGGTGRTPTPPPAPESGAPTTPTSPGGGSPTPPTDPGSGGLGPG